MEKVVYLILSCQKDTFNIIYAGNCKQTSDGDFFTNHSSFKCWTSSHSENSLYLAILPMFESENDARKKVLGQIIARYRPICNLEIQPNPKPEYKIRSKSNSEKIPIPVHCPCCGSDMKVDKILENSTVIRCIQCGLSDTSLNS